MVIDAIIYVFIETIGGSVAYYSIFSLFFVIGTGAVFYKISTT